MVIIRLTEPIVLQGLGCRHPIQWVGLETTTDEAFCIVYAFVTYLFDLVENPIKFVAWLLHVARMLRKVLEKLYRFQLRHASKKLRGKYTEAPDVDRWTVTVRRIQKLPVYKVSMNLVVGDPKELTGPATLPCPRLRPFV